MKVIDLYKKFKRKHCKHKTKHISNYEEITPHSYYEYIRCDKCKSIRKDLISLGHRVEGKWYYESN